LRLSLCHSSVRKGEEEEGRSKRDCPAVILAPPLAAPSSVVPAETSYKGRYGWGRTSRVNQHVPVPENYAETKTQLSIPLTKLPQSPIVTTSTPYALQIPPPSAQRRASPDNMNSPRPCVLPVHTRSTTTRKTW